MIDDPNLPPAAIEDDAAGQPSIAEPIKSARLNSNSEDDERDALTAAVHVHRLKRAFAIADMAARDVRDQRAQRRRREAAASTRAPKRSAAAKRPAIMPIAALST
jgi:hypothetical protein